MIDRIPRRPGNGPQRSELLIWESTAADPAALAKIAATCRRAPEVFVREDGKGVVLLCEDGGTPPSGVSEKRVEPLFCGGRYGPQAGAWLFYVGLWTPADYREELCAWYKLEHAPILLEYPSWDGYRFVEQQVDNGCQFYALHQFSDAAALDSEQRRRSRSTPWFRRLAQNDWFDDAFVRILCHRPGE